MNHIEFNNDAREKILSGIKLVAKAVKATLGPSGRNVLIRDTVPQKPFSTKDGATVAGHVMAKGLFEQMGVEAIQNVANLSDEKAGDGTTTATIIAEDICVNGMEFINKHNEIKNLLDIKRGIDLAAKDVISLLEKRAVNVSKDEKKLKEIALISSNNDKEIADVVYEAFSIAKDQGIANIKRSVTSKTHTTTISGMVLPMGYISKYFVNNYKDDTVEFEEPYVYITNSNIKDVGPNLDALLEKVNNERRELLIICKDMDPLVLDMLIKNKHQANFKVCVCKAPGFGEEMKQMLEDLAVTLNIIPFFENEGEDFEELPFEAAIKRVGISNGMTIGAQFSSIKELATNDEELKEQVKKSMLDRADAIRNLMDNQKDITPYEKSFHQARISRLTNGIVYIHIAANSDPEFVEKQHRVQDSLYAIKSAYEEGIVPGGGSALLSISEELYSKSLENFSEEKKHGYNILLDAIRKPFHQIIENIGIHINEKMEFEIIENFNAGYDALNYKYVENMIDSGIIDPVKVTKFAVLNASSVASLVLTTECAIVDENAYAPQSQYMTAEGRKNI